MILFPIGTINSSNSTGDLASALFEPNKGCSKVPIHTSLISQTESNLLVTRKKAKVYHAFTYEYENLWTREYVTLEKFHKNRDGRVSSFHLVDFSRMQRASMSGTTTRTITYGGTLAALETSYFTTTVGEGGNYCCVWNPYTSKFRIGPVSSISSATSVSFLDASDFGDLANATTNIVIAPMYEVYFSEDQLQFDRGEFNPSEDADGGFLYSGSIGFIQKGVN